MSRIPKPVQSYCRLCERLFCYFLTTKRRLYCAPCAKIEQRLSVVVSNDHIRLERARRRAA